MPDVQVFKGRDVRERRDETDEGESMTVEQRRRCKRCKYAKVMSSTEYYCDYLLMVGHRRPCKIDNCTAFEAVGKQRNRSKYPL